ncbi:MAG: hypothetical protein ACRC2T_16230 [Thermoguttaceae bacterium]
MPPFQTFVFQLVILIVGSVLILFGLAFFACRRRKEILEDYFTPNPDDIEEEFFRRRTENHQQKQLDEKDIEDEKNVPQQDEVSDAWGSL